VEAAEDVYSESNGFIMFLDRTREFLAGKAYVNRLGEGAETADVRSGTNKSRRCRDPVWPSVGLRITGKPNYSPRRIAHVASREAGARTLPVRRSIARRAVQCGGFRRLP